MAQLNVGDCVSDGWSVFKKNAGTSIGLVVIFGIISSIGGVIPVVNVVVQMIVTPVLSAGLSIFALKSVRGEEGKIDDLFKGFNNFGSFLGAYWLYVLIFAAACVPAAVGFGVDVAIHGGIDNLIPYVTVGFSTVSAAVFAVAMLRFSMVYYLIIDGMPVMDAFRESARITRGRSGALFLLVLICVIIMIAGIMLLFVGLLAAGPVCMFAFASAYTRIKQEAAPAGIQGAAAV